ncbi:MAG: carboxypeptidase regulatory-like domain-containing protein, partial [Acidobacteria bacterium]|nr:carboxypeptidase regulatory-like domain-containing protein [Acidobacteriota bacterium]
MRLPFRFLLAYCCACSAGSHAPAQGPRGATLELHFSAGGQPTVARVYIFDQDGRPLLIPGAIHYSRPGEVHSVVDRRAVMQLAPGKYRVRAEKGAEFRPAEKMATLEPGAATRLDMEIPRFHEMNQRGWYSGDLHIHRAPEEMPLLLRAEELNVGPTITRHLGMSREPPPPFPPTHLVPADQAHIASQQNQEVERLGRGHGAVVLLNTSSPIDPNMTVLYPLDLEYCRQARAEGGFVDAEKPIWKNVPVNVAFGAIDAIGIVNNHFHPNGVLLEAEKFGSMERDSPAYQTPAGFAQWMIDLYYSFLQCGFRIPVSAGSASGVMPVWPGFERVYVHLSGPFSYTRWFQDLKAGRSIATNGPLLEVYVEGQPP